jgi:exodeoxyribonuclease-5
MTTISTKTEIELSADQKSAVNDITEWYRYHATSLPFMTMGGYAGTGKTTLMARFSSLLPKSQIAYCAYTGKAASVLRRKLSEVKETTDNYEVSTIHSLIYKPRLDSRGRVVEWVRKRNLDANLIVVDESSMVGKDIHDDLLSYGVPILYVGDHGQLPPVEGSFNLMGNPALKLETPHRFAENKPLIKLSMMARTEGRIFVGEYGDGIKKIHKSQLANLGGDVDAFVKSKHFFDGSAVIICGFNKTRVGLNESIREYNEFKDELPSTVDRVICLRNNKRANVPLYNGSHGTIRHITKRNNANHMNAVIEMDGVSDDYFRGKVSYQGFNAAKIDAYSINKAHEIFDYGYAITAHKSQGSEFENVLVIEEGQHIWAENWHRWLYTAVTRSCGRLLIV